MRGDGRGWEEMGGLGDERRWGWGEMGGDERGWGRWEGMTEYRGTSVKGRGGRREVPSLSS